MEIEKAREKILELLYSYWINGQVNYLKEDLWGNIFSKITLKYENEIKYLLDSGYIDDKSDEITYGVKYIGKQIKISKKGIDFIENKKKSWYIKFIFHINDLNGFYVTLISFFALICSIIAIIISLKK